MIRFWIQLDIDAKNSNAKKNTMRFLRNQLDTLQKIPIQPSFAMLLRFNDIRGVIKSCAMSLQYYSLEDKNTYTSNCQKQRFWDSGCKSKAWVRESNWNSNLGWVKQKLVAFMFYSPLREVAKKLTRIFYGQTDCKIAVLKNLLIFGKKYLQQGVCLLGRGLKTLFGQFPFEHAVSLLGGSLTVRVSWFS